jgi:F-type H+-transporting ATPase subunit delta
VTILTAYQRLVAKEVAKGVAIVEHSGPVSPSVLAGIATSLSARYQRPVSTRTQPNAALFAGLRVRIGDDVYESSVAGQLAALSVSA